MVLTDDELTQIRGEIGTYLMADDDENVAQMLRLGSVSDSADIHWLLYCGTLVFMMQAGFAMLCAGSVRAKNVQNIMLKNLLDACVGALGFWSLGYGVAYGRFPERDNGNEIAGSSFFFGTGQIERRVGCSAEIKYSFGRPRFK